MLSEDEKAIQFYKRFIETEEQELEWMYKEDEEYYRDSIEQKELLIKGWRNILNLITKLQKENDILKNHVHYKKCQKCGKEFRTKRNDAKYCNDCKKENNKKWYKNLTEKQKEKRREQSKISMRKMRKIRKEKGINNE